MLITEPYSSKPLPLVNRQTRQRRRAPVGDQMPPGSPRRERQAAIRRRPHREGLGGPARVR